MEGGDSRERERAPYLLYQSHKVTGRHMLTGPPFARVAALSIHMHVHVYIRYPTAQGNSPKINDQCNLAATEIEEKLGSAYTSTSISLIYIIILYARLYIVSQRIHRYTFFPHSTDKCWARSGSPQLLFSTFGAGG